MDTIGLADPRYSAFSATRSRARPAEPAIGRALAPPRGATFRSAGIIRDFPVSIHAPARAG
jgi:hypothetical protein